MISERLERYVRRRHGDRADELLERLEALIDELGLADPERVPLAVVSAAETRVDGLEGSMRLARVDWRDVLGQGGLERSDWRRRIDRILGGEAQAGG